MLVSIASQQETDEILRLAPEGERFWGGASDINTQGSWQWAGDRQPFTFQSWKKAPTNTWAAGKDCLDLQKTGKSTLQWSNEYCYANRHFVCKNLFYQSEEEKKIEQANKVRHFSKEEIAKILSEVREYVKYWDRGTEEKEMSVVDETRAQAIKSLAKSKYVVSHAKKDWDEALQQCRDIGSDLVSFKRREDFAELKKTLGTKEAFWTGGKFSTDKKWNGWHWSNGHPFKKWSKVAYTKGEKCLSVTKGQLQDGKCDVKLRYVCRNPIYRVTQ